MFQVSLIEWIIPAPKGALSPNFIEFLIMIHSRYCFLAVFVILDMQTHTHILQLFYN